MDAINAIIVRHQSAHKINLSNATRKAMAISLKATRRPCWQTQQERCEGGVIITTILISRQQLSSQEHQLPQCKCNKRKTEALYTRKLRQIRKIHAPDLYYKRGINNKTNKQKRTCKQNKKQSCRDTYAMCHARQLLEKPRIESPDRASDIVPSDERTSMSDDNNNYHFVSNPKIKRMFIVWCSGLATAQVESKVQKIFWMAPHNKDA